MRGKWQVLRLVTGVLFLLSAILFEFFTPQWRNKRIVEGLFGFLGLFYIVSSVILNRLFGKMGEER